MPTTIKAIVQGDHIEWEGTVGDLLPGNEPVEVLVTIPDRPRALPPAKQGELRVNALRTLATQNPFSDINDPVQWQRLLREERELPGRDG